MTIEQLFFELIRVAIGTQLSLSRQPSPKEWAALYDIAKKQSLVGVCFAAVQRLQNLGTSGTLAPLSLPEMDYLRWMGMAAKIQQRNEVVNRQCVEVERILAERGFKCSVMKGQAVAAYYRLHDNDDDNPSMNLQGLRQSGDIDVWVPVKIETLVEFVKSMGWKYEAKHAHVSFTFPDGDAPDAVEVELHPTPGELRCPWHNRRLQSWFREHREVDTEFNLVFLLEHMYHHALFEGIGLRQFMDYYFVLSSQHVNKLACQQVMKVIDSLGMKRFAAGVMDIMHNVFGMPEEELLCEADHEVGALLLSEVMTGGNFGHYDERYKEQQSRNLFVHGLGNLKRKWPMLRVAFWEVVCSPFWSLWQITWRKRHGYF